MPRSPTLFPPLAPNRTRCIIDIGCSTGGTTMMLSKHDGAVIGVDRAWKCLKKCKGDATSEAEKGIEWSLMDCVAFPHLIAEKILGMQCADVVVFLDIGGDRMAHTVLSLTEYLFMHVNPRLVVIKSEEMWKSLADWREPPDPHDRPDVSLGRDLDWGVVKETIKVAPSATKWTEATTEEVKKGRKMHPTKACIRMSPVSGLSICRFWSYGVCNKFEMPSEEYGECPYDHVTCHVCLKEGHRAQECEEWLKTR